MYMTAQRKLLFEFFSTHPDISITARELYTKLNKNRLHMTCLNCGKTYHISQKISEKLTEDVLNTDAFSIDEAQTTIYGRCKTCK